MSPVDKLIALVEELDGKATEGPWEASYNVSSLDDCELLGPQIHENGDRVVIAADENGEPGDFQFSATARTLLPAAVKALKVARDWMLSNIEAMECRGDEDCDHCVGLQALAEIDRIAASVEVTK